MKTRFISGAVLTVVVAAMLIMGGWVMMAGLLLLTLGGVYEFHHVSSARPKETAEGEDKSDAIPRNPMMITALVLSAIWLLMVVLFTDKVMNGPLGLHFIGGMMLVFMVECVVLFPKRTFADAALSLMSVVYVAMLFSVLYLIRASENGHFFVWYVIAVSWGSDTCAYFTGMMLGKHKMASKLSPKKTVEGAIGGVVGAIIICVIFGMIIASTVMIDSAVMLKFSLLTGLIGGIVSEIGDLFASSIKRVLNVKDYSRLIPGHGGVLDRFDSTLMAAPVVLILLDLFLMI